MVVDGVQRRSAAPTSEHLDDSIVNSPPKIGFHRPRCRRHRSPSVLPLPCSLSPSSIPPDAPIASSRPPTPPSSLGPTIPTIPTTADVERAHRPAQISPHDARAAARRHHLARQLARARRGCRAASRSTVLLLRRHRRQLEERRRQREPVGQRGRRARRQQARARRASPVVFPVRESCSWPDPRQVLTGSRAGLRRAAQGPRHQGPAAARLRARGPVGVPGQDEQRVVGARRSADSAVKLDFLCSTARRCRTSLKRRRGRTTLGSRTTSP